MLFTKVRKLVIVVSGAAVITFIGGCTSAGPTSQRVSYLDQKGHIHYVPQFAAGQQNVGPYALTGRTAAPTMAKMYDQKGHLHYVPQWFQGPN